jgi:hypothetical protein
MINLRQYFRDGFVMLSLLTFFMLAPAIGAFKLWPLPSAWTDALTLLFVGLFFAVAVIGNRESTFRFNAAVLMFIGFVAALSVSVITNEHTYDSTWRWYLIGLIISALALLSASEFKALNDERFQQSLCFSLWVGGIVYALLSLAKYYGILSQFLPLIEPSEGRLSGLWSQPNLTSTLCWLGVLAGAIMFPGRSRRIWFTISILVFGWVLACAASRMSWLMGVGLLTLVAFSRLPPYRDKATERIGKSLAWAVISVFLLMLLVPVVNQPIIDELVYAGWLEKGQAVSVAGRDVFSQSARLTELGKVLTIPEMFSWYQWFVGIGPGNYPLFSYQADMSGELEALAPGTWLHSHNLFTMVFIELGLFGLLVLAGLLFYVVKAALRGPIGVAQFFSLGGIGILFIHSNLEFPLWYLWFLVLFCLLLSNLFEVRQMRGDSKWLKPSVGAIGLVMVIALLVNVGSQYLRISEVAFNSNRDRQDFQTLTLLANDSLMGPYAILRKYRDFAPEEGNLDWQLQEARRMKAWQPRDLVVLREFSLLVLKQDVDAACDAARKIAFRYPRSGPVMLEHTVLANRLTASEITRIVGCVEGGLGSRGETIQSIQEKNQAVMES